MGIENLLVEVWGPEVPILDGSAAPYVRAFEKAGLARLPETRRVLRVREPVWIASGNAGLIALPDPEFRITFTLNYPGTSIGTQHYSVTVNPETFAKELAPARTFCLESEVEELRRNGLIQGGSLANALVFGPNGPLNAEGLRLPDEPVRHKILDLVGDLALLGVPVQGHFISLCAGHTRTIRFTRTLSDLTRKTRAY